ncbi:outer membrane protein assembly factor BamB family protein [Roseiconus nitratireducens]|nr:PQQ-binding-like beta-propeller repeat protein [Roseiconus nitratireducens]
MSPQTAARLGLEEAWRRQMPVPAGSDSMVDQQIVAFPDMTREFVEVVGPAKEGEPPEVYYRVSTDQAGPDGQPIGKEEAERLARREVRFLKRRVGETTIRTEPIPEIRLYTASDNGTIECRDAETGVPIWITQVGNARLRYGKLGINQKFVTVTNGGNLIKIDADTGEPITTVRTMSTPMYGAIHAGDFSLVPTIRNGVEGYPLEDITVDPFMEIVAGLALAPPTKSPSSTKVAWATDRGFVYVMELSGEPSVLFRLNTDGIVSGRIAAAPGDRFFFGSESGQVYGIRATRTGEVLWNQPFGEPFYEAPYLVGGKVLLPSAYGNLFALDEKTGLRTWDRPVPNVKKILGGFDGRVYVSLLSGQFAAIDLDTGKILDLDSTLRPQRLLVNRVSDRLYFVNSVGTVQCLRPVGKILPTVRESTDPGAEEPEPETEKKPKEETETPGNDPFNSNDPFGAGGNDPFGGGDEKMDDPFAVPGGDNSDPFSGDPFGN